MDNYIRFDIVSQNTEENEDILIKGYSSESDIKGNDVASVRLGSGTVKILDASVLDKYGYVSDALHKVIDRAAEQAEEYPFIFRDDERQALFAFLRDSEGVDAHRERLKDSLYNILDIDLDDFTNDLLSELSEKSIVVGEAITDCKGRKCLRVAGYPLAEWNDDGTFVHQKVG